MSVTLKDIANELNLSVNAVSRALRGMPDIGKKTTELVRETAKRMGYRKNIAASCLKTARSMTVGVVIPDICNPVFSYIYKGIEDYLSQKNYTVMLGNSNESASSEDTVLENMIAHSVDGIIIVPCNQTKNYRDENHSIPIVALQRRPISENHFVQTSDFEGGYLAAKHLCELGHRAFSLIFAPKSISSSLDRYNGFMSYLKEHNFSESNVEFIECDGTKLGGYTAIKERYTSKNLNTSAIFCFSDYVAIGVYSALNELGIKIPDEISVIGYDNDEFCDILNPPLTTVDMLPYELGRRSARLMLKLINGEKDPDQINEKTILPILAIRNSTKKIAP